MKNIFRKIFVAILALTLVSCASIVSKSQYPVSIESSSSRANFVIKDESGRVIHTGKTPATVTLDAGDEFLSKANYTVEYGSGKDKKITSIKPTLDGWFIGNILIGGIIGIVVDGATGAMYKLPKVVNLGSDDQLSLTNSLQVVSVDALSYEQKQNLELISVQ